MTSRLPVPSTKRDFGTREATGTERDLDKALKLVVTLLMSYNDTLSRIAIDGQPFDIDTYLSMTKEVEDKVVTLMTGGDIGSVEYPMAYRDGNDLMVHTFKAVEHVLERVYTKQQEQKNANG